MPERKRILIRTDEKSVIEWLLLLVLCNFFSFSFSIRPNSSRNQAGIFRRFVFALPAGTLGALIGMIGSTRRVL